MALLRVVIWEPLPQPCLFLALLTPRALEFFPVSLRSSCKEPASDLSTPFPSVMVGKPLDAPGLSLLLCKVRGVGVV